MRSGVASSRSSVRGTGLGAAERLVDRGAREALDRAAEVLAHRLLAEGALRPEVGDADRLLERTAGGDDLAKYRQQPLGRQGAGRGGNAPQNLALPLRTVGGSAAL